MFYNIFVNFAAKCPDIIGMNRICCMAIAFFVCLLAMANPISQQQALRKAQDFAGKRMRLSSGQLKLAHVGQKDGVAGWFAFNMPEKKGFVIISGNDQAEEILGYADKGEFDYDNMPENMKVWLEQYSQSIQAINDGAMRPAKAKHPTEVVEPLITSLWGQKEPFNSQCPTINASRCPAGCTAVAMAQVMRYHRFPTTSIDAIPAYTTVTVGLDMPELPATTFDWDKMPDVLTPESPQESINEVAKLMLYCGQSTDMDYVATGSGAYTYLIPQRLPKYFNYPKTIHYVYRRSYDEAQWDSLLMHELLNGRPVIYTAYTNLSQGHTFICDGYDGNGLYHINWGWVGAGNGYYRISVACAEGEGLDENIKNYQLSINQSALLGIKPEGKDEFVAPEDVYNAYSRPSLKNGTTYTRSAKKNDFQNITLKQVFINSASTTKSLSYGVALFNESGKLTRVLAAFTTKLSSGATKTMEAADLSFGAGIVGHYTLKAVYKPSSTADWQAMGGTDRNYIDVTITNTEMTLTSVPKAHFEVKGVEMEDDHLHILFDNNDEDFFGPIYLRRMVPSTGQITAVASDNISFESGTSRDFSIYVDKSKKFDPYADEFYLSVDEYNTQYFYTNLSEEESPLEKSIEILNLSEDGTTIVGDRAMCRVTVTNVGEKRYKNYLTLSTIDSNDLTTEVERELIELQPGASLVRQYEAPISDYTVDYSLMASHHRTLYTWVNDTTEVKHVSKGAIYWTKDGQLKTKVAEGVFEVPEEAVAINLRGAYTSNNVVPNSNPNTIYMLNTTMPKSLKETNYVDGSGQGRSLTLTDGYDYLIPREMTFGKVTYSRELSDSDSLVWTTIALPFKPAEIKADDESILPRVNEQDVDSHLRILEMTGVNDTIVATSFITELEDYTPYLMAYDTVLVGKKLTFEAQRCTVSPTIADSIQVVAGNYTLHGTNAENSLANIYTFDGNRLHHNEEASSVASFRAYLTSGSADSPELLAIDIDNPIPEIPFVKLPGDANVDERVNIADIMLIVRYIMEEHPELFNEINADYDGNGIIDVTDVTATITDILGGEDMGAKPQTE